MPLCLWRHRSMRLGISTALGVLCARMSTILRRSFVPHWQNLNSASFIFLIYHLISPDASNIRSAATKYSAIKDHKKHAYVKVRHRNDTQLRFSFSSIARVARYTRWPLPCNNSARTKAPYLHWPADYRHSTSFILTQESSLLVVF